MVCTAALDVGLLVQRETQPRPSSARACVSRGAERPARSACRRRCGGDLPRHLSRTPAMGCGLRLDRSRTADRRARGSHAPRSRRALEHGQVLDARALVRPCARVGSGRPIFGLARAETMLRDGRYIEAVAHAEGRPLATRHSSPAHFRLPGVRLTSRRAREDALALYRPSGSGSARATATRDAQWGQLVCMIDLELPLAVTEACRTLRGRWLRRPTRDSSERQGTACTYQMSGLARPRGSRHGVRALPAVSDPLIGRRF